MPPISHLSQGGESGMYELRFAVRHQYPESSSGILVEVKFPRAEGSELRIEAKVDTGAEFCVFSRHIAEALGIDVETGLYLRMSTATGDFDTYGHELSFSVLEHDFIGIVFFAGPREFTRNVLGRRGWLDQLRVGIVEYDRHLLIGDYNR